MIHEIPCLCVRRGTTLISIGVHCHTPRETMDDPELVDDRICRDPYDLDQPTTTMSSSSESVHAEGVASIPSGPVVACSRCGKDFVWWVHPVQLCDDCIGMSHASALDEDKFIAQIAEQLRASDDDDEEKRVMVLYHDDEE